MTARWVVDEVRPSRDLQVTWQPISLFFKNESEEGSRAYEATLGTHRLLRVLEAVRSAGGDVEALYWEYGRRIHHDKDRAFDPAEALGAVGLDRSLAAAADDVSWDEEIRSRMDRGLELAGDDIGTPIIATTNRAGTPVAFFGPVITRVPPRDESLELWDAVETMMNIDGVWELKRNRTDRPDLGARP